MRSLGHNKEWKMSHEYSVSLAVMGEEIAPGFMGWLVHREYSGDLFVAITEAGGVGGPGRAKRFATIDDAVSAIRDLDESAQVRVMW